MKKTVAICAVLAYTLTMGGWGVLPAHSQLCGMPYFSGQDATVHHYVYENGQYVPQYYRYDPLPHYRAYTYNVPPHYVVWNLHQYQGLDRGRGQEYARAFDLFKF